MAKKKKIVDSGQVVDSACQFCSVILEVTRPNSDGTVTVTKIPLPCPVGIVLSW